MPPEAISPRRPFGASGVSLSAWTFGTMRLHLLGLDGAEAADFLTALYDRGVTSFHVSPEYESHALACAALKGLRRRRPAARLEIVAKIAAPHFEETGFDAARARARVEACRAELDVERIDLVQWLVRHTPNDDRPRLEVLARDGRAAEDAWSALKAEGRVGALAIFPYSDGFLRASLDLPWVDGVVSYLNLEEREAAPYLDRLAAEGRGFAAIRPLNAGRLKGRLREALRFPLAHPAVASVILSASDLAQAEAALEAVASAPVSAAAFHTVEALEPC
jgi:aryl-alcohol dehydrogenase-like predicted oxidoreductase